MRQCDRCHLKDTDSQVDVHPVKIQIGVEVGDDYHDFDLWVGDLCDECLGSEGGIENGIKENEALEQLKAAVEKWIREVPNAVPKATT